MLWPSGTRESLAPIATNRLWKCTGTTGIPECFQPNILRRNERSSAEKLPGVFQTHFPICWNCYIAETYRRLYPDRIVNRNWNAERAASTFLRKRKNSRKTSARPDADASTLNHVSFPGPMKERVSEQVVPGPDVSRNRLLPNSPAKMIESIPCSRGTMDTQEAEKLGRHKRRC